MEKKSNEQSKDVMCISSKGKEPGLERGKYSILSERVLKRRELDKEKQRREDQQRQMRSASRY